MMAFLHRNKKNISNVGDTISSPLICTHRRILLSIPRVPNLVNILRCILASHQIALDYKLRWHR
jgi:hypothetical protein